MSRSVGNDEFHPPLTLPKLIFFRGHPGRLPAYIRLHLQQQVECLRRFFDVVVVEGPADYSMVCEAHQPDIALLEAGVYTKRAIRNTHCHPEVPKLGLLHSDAYCITRTVAMADFDKWGVEDVFTTCLSMAEYTPELADRLFVWPNFVDEGLYRDYGESKTIPVLLTGSKATHYPWRIAVGGALSAVYPTLTTPHQGWFDATAASRMIYGEPYARMINASLVAPSCGTIAKELVRKHLEIPASKACLIAEPSASLAAAGFVDMENCVYADEASVVDKVAYLFDNPAELSRITNNGYALVHSRHTASQRDQVRQWYDLRVRANSTERIRQPGPFAELQLVEMSRGASNGYVVNGGRDRLLLSEADSLFRAKKYGEAERLYLQAYNLHFAAEPVLGIARCRLALGSALSALNWLGKTIEHCSEALAGDPDPVEWAYLIRGELCLGNLWRAAVLAQQHADMGHPELSRIRTVVSALAGREVASGAAGRRKSLHVLDPQNDAEWLEELRSMMQANGQTQCLQRLDSLPGAQVLPRKRRSSVIRGWVGASGSVSARPLHRQIRLKGLAMLLRLGSRLPKSSLSEVVADLVSGMQGTSIVVVASSFRDVLRTGVVDAAAASPYLPEVRWVRDKWPQVVELRQSVGGLGYQRIGSLSIDDARRDLVLANIDLLLILDPRIASTLIHEETTNASTILLAQPDTLAGAELQETMQCNEELTICRSSVGAAGQSYMVVKQLSPSAHLEPDASMLQAQRDFRESGAV